jgi:AcrR family transcriptional regulator
MPRPSRKTERRAEYLPHITAVFARRGYRRTTTAALARACGVQENVLYRLWSSKRAMFIASIEHVFEASAAIWRDLLNQSTTQAVSAAQRILQYESVHHGELGNYRIVFAGLSETDDPVIRGALRRMFSRFHEFLATQISASRCAAEPESTAWALIGLGLAANVGRELGMLAHRERQQLILAAGERLIGAAAGSIRAVP